MSLKAFGDIAVRLSRNPLGIIALAFVLVYAIAGLLTIEGNFQANERIVLVWFLVLFPVLVLCIFYLLVSRHHNKLYAPSDFSNEGNFMKTLELKIEQSPKLNQIEELTEKIKEEINNQPLYRYIKLSETGKRLILAAFGGEQMALVGFAERNKFENAEVMSQAKILAEYGWLSNDNNKFCITTKGREDVSTFEDICYGRFR